MIVRAISNNHESSSREWVFCRGLSAYKTGQKAIEQGIKSDLLEFQDDCFFALQNGIDWLERLGSKNQQELLDKDVINIISNRYGVVSVQDYQSIVTDRAYSSSCNVYTIFSEDAFLFEFSQGI
ncbi:MAG: hypothetical protein IKY45_05265 [Clostridia bacterium]|nr:hypothetical protein [Clostridia bacterium]